MEKVRVGVIGLGLWGETILNTLRGLAKVETTAVSSRSSERAKQIAEKYGISSYYTNFRELAGDPNVDVVAVVTEEDRHLEPTLAALEAGKHVFLEKPIASTLEDANRIIGMARASDVVLMVGHIFRFDARHIYAKELINQGRVGKIASFYAKHNVAKKKYYIYRRVPLPMVSSIHEFDLARWYLDDEPDEIYCAQYNALGEEVADTYWITVRFKRGTVAVFQTVWLITDNAPVWLDINIEVMGAEGVIQLDSRHQGITTWSIEGTRYPNVGFFPVIQGVHYGALRNEWEYFIDCVQERREPDVLSLEDAREALRIALLADESARTGRVVKA